MRMSKSDLHQILGASPSSTAASAPGPVKPVAAPTPAISINNPPPAPSSAAQVTPSTDDLRFELARALPALWNKAQQAPVKGESLHEKDKLRDLLVWLLTKKGATIRQRHTVSYVHEGRPATGRIDVVANQPATQPLAIEVDWAYARPSLEKLQAAHQQGMRVMWVCGAKLDRTHAKALRTKANAELGRTNGWLFMFHLEHGWL